MKIGELTVWKDVPMGGRAGYKEGRYRKIYLSKQDWQLDPQNEGCTYIQGITRTIDPLQPVIYLGQITEEIDSILYNLDLPQSNQED